MNRGHRTGDYPRNKGSWTRTRRLGFALGVSAIAMTWTTIGPVRPATATAPEPTTGVLRICTGCEKHIGNGARYQYVILHAWEASLIPRLKASNPGIKVLVYKDTEATVSRACHSGVDDTRLPAGVGYCWTVANHPKWFLTDARGKRIEFADYPDLWLMDVGNRAYQRKWVNNVVREAKALGFDGVVLDDVNDGGQIYWHRGRRTIAKYPTADAWTKATASFMAYVGPALKAQGLLALPNIAIAEYWTKAGRARWDSWTGYASGGIQEYFTKWSRDSGKWLTGADWNTRQRYLRSTDGAGRIFLGVTYAPINDVRSQLYARASFLLDWQGGRSALIYQPTYPTRQDAWTPTWTADLGTPLGLRYHVGVAWRRNYSDGTVLVNPSRDTAQTVSLGARYLTSNGSEVSSVVVPATNAVILHTAGPMQPAPASQARTRPPW